MKSTQDVPSDQQCLLNAVAPSGRSIEPCVFLVAQGIANQAVSYAEKFLGDACVAVNLKKDPAAVKLGRKGGKVTAKRCREYLSLIGDFSFLGSDSGLVVNLAFRTGIPPRRRTEESASSHLQKWNR